MRQPIVLCADSFSVKFPEVLGLSGENLASQGWLQVFSDGEEARQYVADHPATPEAWIVGSDDMEAINVAAAIKADCCQGGWPARDCGVYLVSSEQGEVPHHAQAAALDGILSPSRFLRRYAEEKLAWTQQCNVYLSLVQGAEPIMSVPLAALPSGGSLSQKTVSFLPGEATYRQEKGAWCGGFGEEVARGLAAVEAAEPPESRDFGVTVDKIKNEGFCSTFQETGMVIQKAPQVELKPILRQGLLFPVLSASGGVGKSAVALLFALSATQRGHKTLLIDADFQFGQCAESLGFEAEKSGRPGVSLCNCMHFDAALDGTLDAVALATATKEGELAVVGALKNATRGEECVEAFGALLKEVLKQFDVVIVDTSSWWSEVQASLIEQATKVFYVLDQRPSALAAARKALELCGQCGLATGSFTYLLNRCKRGSLYGSADIARALGGVQVVELSEGGLEVEECMTTGRVKELLRFGNPLACSIEAFLDEVLPRQDNLGRQEAPVGKAVKKKRKGLFSLRREDECPF